MLFDYSPLWETMKKKNITTYMLISKHGICSKTIYNLKHNKSITMYTLGRLCKVLKCTPDEVIRFEYDD